MRVGSSRHENEHEDISVDNEHHILWQDVTTCIEYLLSVHFGFT
jgi:hypothetical protein